MHNHTEEILNTHSGLFFKHFFGKLGSLNPPKIYPSYHCICFWQSSRSSGLHTPLSVTIVINIYLTLILNVNIKGIPGFELPSP